MYKTQLKTTPLGTTGLEITRVGFGAWALGAITGFRLPGQVDPIVTAASLELTDEDINEIEAGSTR